MKKALSLISGSITFLLFAPIVCAEVSDKIPSFSQLWFQGTVLAILGYLTARFAPWWSLIPVVFAAMLLLANWDMFQDLAEDIRHEQGPYYSFAAWSSAIVPLLITAFGFVMRQRRSRKDSTVHDA